MRKLGRVLGLFAGLLLAAPGVQAQSFVVGVEQTAYFPIYEYKGGDYTGFSRELLDAFAQSKGYQFRYEALPIKRLFADFLGKDTLDFKYPDHPLWQADMKKGLQISYSEPVFESVEGGMVLPANSGKPLTGLKRLGTIRGFTPWPYLDAVNAKTLALEESDDIAGLVQKALLGRLDVIYLNTDIVDYHLSQVLAKPGALVLDPALPKNDVAYLLSTRKHPQVVEEFNAFLKAQPALIAELKKKYHLD